MNSTYTYPCSQDTNKRVFILLKLGLTLLNERDPIRMMSKFSHDACNIMHAQSMTIGLIDDPVHLAGRFCTTTVTDNQTLSCYNKTSCLQERILRPLYESQNITNTQSDFSNPSLLGLPILSAGQNHGVLYFLGKREGNRFDEEDEHLATTMAEQLAMLYENIKLHDAILKQDLKMRLEIQDRKNIEADLRQSEERLKLALKVGKMNGWDWNLKRNEIKEFGYFPPLSYPNAHAQIGTFDHFIKCVLPEDREEVTEMLRQSIKTGMDLDMQFRCMIDNKFQWIASRGQMYYDQEGLPLCMIGVGVLITECKKIEELEALHQNEKAQVARINSMGEMASTLAHELTQPLTVINAYISGCIRRLENGTQEKVSLLNAMKKVMQNVTLAGEIIHRMKNFVRKGELYFESIAINEVIKKTISLIHYEDSQDKPITTLLDLEEDIPFIEADKIQIKQVLLNLIRNSIEAMRSAQNGQPTITIRTAKKGSMVSVSIEDNGPGIAPHTGKALFAPYFTTKPDGMGMGLAICHTIIKAHGGQISLKPLLEKGTCIEFILPYQRLHKEDAVGIINVASRQHVRQ